MTIELKTIQDVKDFVEISSKYNDCAIMVEQGLYRVDGKSTLGIFSLNLLNPIYVFVNSRSKDSKISFFNNIRKWKKER